MLHSHHISKFLDLERSWVFSLEWQDSTAVLQDIFCLSRSIKYGWIFNDNQVVLILKLQN